MRKLIARTAGVAIAMAAFTAAGAGIASADSAGADQPETSRPMSLLDSVLSPVKYYEKGGRLNVCGDLATPSSRLNTTVCGDLSRDYGDGQMASMAQAKPPADQEFGAGQQGTASQHAPADPSGAGLLGNSGLPILKTLKGLGIG